MGKYFGTDGFRGKVGVDLSCEHAFKIGRYLGYYLLQYANRSYRKPRVLIGKDTRLSSDMLESAISAGLAASGVDVLLLGVAPTSSVAYVTAKEGIELGIIITASHNPYYDNGIKIINQNGEKISDDLTVLIENHLDSNSSTVPCHTEKDIGTISPYRQGLDSYLSLVTSLASHSYSGLKIGIDAANGAAYETAYKVLNELGADVIAFGSSPDGLNINDNCGSTHPERLAEAVKGLRTNVAFAFDGDADRCIAVDENGRVIDGDGLLYVLAKRYKRQGRLKGGAVVSTVMSNGGLARALEREGISLEMTKVGDRYVYERMLKTGAMLGGEQSGHIIIRDLPIRGDGLVSAIGIIEEMIDTGCTLSELAEGFSPLPQRSAGVRVADKSATMADSRLKALIAEIELALGEDSRILVRESGTEPLIRIMAEARTDELCAFAVNRIIHHISSQEKNND